MSFFVLNEANDKSRSIKSTDVKDNEKQTVKPNSKGGINSPGTIDKIDKAIDNFGVQTQIQQQQKALLAKKKQQQAAAKKQKQIQSFYQPQQPVQPAPAPQPVQPVQPAPQPVAQPGFYHPQQPVQPAPTPQPVQPVQPPQPSPQPAVQPGFYQPQQQPKQQQYKPGNTF